MHKIYDKLRDLRLDICTKANTQERKFYSIIIRLQN